MIRPLDWWMEDVEPGAAVPAAQREDLRKRGKRSLLLRLAINLIGGGVFVALLVASARWPFAATPLRILACLWGIGMVMLKVAVWSAAERR